MNRWLLYQTLSCRLWARSGLLPARRRVRVPRSAPGQHGARAWRGPTWRRSSCCGPPAANSSRATCSTGGTSRADAGCARDAPTICCGCRTWPITTCEHDRRPCAARHARCPSSRRRRWLRMSSDAYQQPRVSAQHASIFEHCLRAIDKGLTAGAHGLPLMGSGDWNDGLNRVGQGRPRRKHVARILPVYGAHRVRAALRGARRRRPRRALPAGGGAAADHAGVELGRRMVSPRLLRRWHAARVESERRRQDRFDCRSRGRCCRGRCRWRSRNARWTRCGRIWCAASSQTILLLTPPFDRGRARSRLHQGLRAGHSRKRRPVHARGDLGGHGVGAPRQRRRSRSNCSTC